MIFHGVPKVYNPEMLKIVS